MRTTSTKLVVPIAFAVLLASGCDSTARAASSGASPPTRLAVSRRAVPPTTTTPVTSVLTTNVPSTNVTSTSVSPTTVAPSAPSSSEEPEAVRVVRSLGYTPRDTDDYTYPDFNDGLHVIVGFATGSATGYAQRAFFFVHGRYIGSDVTEPSATVQLVWRTEATIALGYTVYKPSDPMCCPTGGAVTVRYFWTGARLEALDPVPTLDIRR